MQTTQALTNENSAERIVHATRLVHGSRYVPVQSNCAVAVAAGSILSLGTLSELSKRWPDATVDSFPGATILPGLVDAHVHCTFPGDGTSYESAVKATIEDRLKIAESNLTRHLASGVTTVRDVGSHVDFLSWHPTDPNALPRLLRYGPPVTQGHMAGFGSTNGDGPKQAESNIAAGADGIKLVASGGGTPGTIPHEATYTDRQLAEIVQIAHQENRLVTTHALASEAIRRAIRAGTDGIEHLGFLASDGNSKFDRALAKEAISLGVTFCSTLSVNYAYIALAEQGAASPDEVDTQRQRTGVYLANARKLHALEAKIVAGTDAGWKYTPFGEFATELELLYAAGLSCLEVIHVATAGAAEYLRIDGIGRVQPGMSADLLVVAGDPTSDISSFRSPMAVYRAGRPICRDQLIQGLPPRGVNL